MQQVGHLDASRKTMVCAVIGQNSMARAMELELQRCCPWALLKVDVDDQRITDGATPTDGED